MRPQISRVSAAAPRWAAVRASARLVSKHEDDSRHDQLGHRGPVTALRTAPFGSEMFVLGKRGFEPREERRAWSEPCSGRRAGHDHLHREDKYGDQGEVVDETHVELWTV